MLETLKRNESFSYKRLSKEEMESRQILGRLVGPCADFTIPTRNGRKYNESLWNNVFEDEIVLEKINNKCLFGELGHPLDREEVDPEKIAIALNEKPVKNANGQLIACFDILNTPSGKILKTLCDYGTTIGISSRGSGDLIEEMGEEVVDPDTYMFECFDAVILPAVKAARLKYMTESMNVKDKKLKKALRESIENAPEEEKEIMRNTLEELEISLDENMTEDDEIIEVEIVPSIDIKQESAITLKEEDESENLEDEDSEIEDVEDKEVAETEEPIEEQPEEEIEKTEAYTVSTMIDQLQEYEGELSLEFKPIVIEDKEYEITTLEFDNSEEGKVIVNIGYSLPENEEEDNIVSEDENLEDEEAQAGESDEVEEINEPEPAEDNGEEDEEILESLKDMIRQKDLLEQELKDLKSSRTVEDSKVKELTEELDKYKDAFARTSKIAARVRVAEAQIKNLNEKLVQKDNAINALKTANASKLNESIKAEKEKTVTLTEQVKVAQTKVDDLNKKLANTTSEYEKKLSESVKIAKAYKAKCAKMLEQYISFRASQLGVRPSDISSRLGDKTSFEQINEVCDKILTENVTYTRPYSINKNSKVVIKEQKENRKNDDYDWDSLYELAGLNEKF